MLTKIRDWTFVNAPTFLTPPLFLMPFFMQKIGLEYALNHLFKEAINDGDTEFLREHVLGIVVVDLNLRWFVTFKDNRLVLLHERYHCQCDVTFKANGDDLLLIADRREDPDTLFFQRRLLIEGDTELGLAVKNLIDSVELALLPNRVNRIISYCGQQISYKNATM